MNIYLSQRRFERALETYSFGIYFFQSRFSKKSIVFCLLLSWSIYFLLRFVIVGRIYDIIRFFQTSENDWLEIILEPILKLAWWKNYLQESKDLQSHQCYLEQIRYSDKFESNSLMCHLIRCWNLLFLQIILGFYELKTQFESIAIYWPPQHY